MNGYIIEKILPSTSQGNKMLKMKKNDNGDMQIEMKNKRKDLGRCNVKVNCITNASVFKSHLHIFI